MDSSVKFIIAMFLVVVLAFAVYVAYSNMTKKEKFTDKDSTPSVRVCLFYATWCHHCEKYLDSGVFDTTYGQIEAKNKNIKFEKIDYDQNKNMANKYDVNSFPTIVAIDGKNGNKIATFDGDRYDKNELTQFALKAASN